LNKLSGYVFSSLREGDIALYRGSGNGMTPILLVAAEETSPGCVERLEHEYALKSELDADWAARPVALTHDNGRMTLVLEDPGGTPLDRLLGAPMEVECFLRLGIGIAVALGKLQQRGLVHKDVKPANILVNGATGAVKFTGFGIASRLPREHQAPAPPEVIAGTLAYMAPEQTGRMNRSIDSRSDLYALGVTLYEMLTGSLPFTAADPMEWVHCHIARKPVPPSERVTAVPTQGLGDRAQAAREDRRRPLPDCRGSHLRSAALSRRLGLVRSRQVFPVGESGRAGPVTHSREAIRA
jgi:serine/threonine protein kinase